MTSPEDPPEYAQSPFTPQVHEDRTLAGTEGMSQNALATMRSKLIESIMQLITQAITGILTPFGLGSTFTQLQEWANDISDTIVNLPGIGDIVESITGFVGGGLGFLTDWFTDLLSIFGHPLGLGTGSVSLGDLESIPLLGPIFGFVQDLIDGIIGLITGGLGIGNPLGSLFDVFGDFVNGLFGFGSAGSGLPIIGSGQVAAVPQNLLINGDFHSATAFASSLGVAWDGTQTHSGTGGSAKFVLNGTEKSLLSNGIDVVTGDKLDLVAWAKWSGLTGAGPISLMLSTYNAAGTLISTTTIDSVASPGASGGWVQLDGQYTVPAGVAEISARFSTAAGLTAGTVWFDDASVKKPNTVPPAAVGGPLAGAGNLLEDITDLVDTISGGIGGALADVADRLADMLTPISNLNGSNINAGSILDDFTNIPEVIGNIVTSFLGWDPGTYTHSQSAAAMSAQSQGLLNANAQLSQLQAYLASQPWTSAATGGGGVTTPTGKSAQDAFERSGSLGSNWANSNSSYQCDGHNAYWNPTSYGLLTADLVWQGTNASSNTDYQVSQIVIGNFAPTTTALYYGWNHVDGRVGSGQKCRFSVRSDGYWQFTVSGTIVASGTGVKLGIGSAMALLCGNKPTNTLNKFTCMVNNTTVWTGTASSSTGASFRGWGFGSGMDGFGIPPFGVGGFGGKVNQWYAADVVV